MKLPRWLSTLLIMLAILCASRVAEAVVKGEVVRRVSGCDYFIVATAKSYDLLEWYGGNDPDKGDILVGNYESYGMHDILNDTADETLTVWVEDYGLSKESALDKLVEACE